MKVLHVFIEINFSGAEMMYVNAAPLFNNEGYQLAAVSTGKEKGNFADRFNLAGIQVFHRPLPTGKYSIFDYFKYIKEFVIFIKSEGFDLVHIHRSTYFSIFVVACHLANVRAIRTTHNVFKNRWFTWPKAYLERKIASSFFRVIYQTIGESVYKNELLYYKNPSVRINNWFNAEKFFPSVSTVEKLECRKSLEINQDAFVIITAGSCSDIKNHKDILYALALLPEEKSFIFIHLGSGCALESEVLLSAKLGIEGRVKFFGNQVDVRKYLIAADVFVMTSKFEGLSIAAIEAMACRLPVILYNSPGLRDLIQDDDNGYLIEHSPEILSDKILELSKNGSLRSKKAESALNFVESNFSMQKGVGEIIKLYELQSRKKINKQSFNL